jgi:TRAP-type C4-dicarboxylate transport system permease small subunit
LAEPGLTAVALPQDRIGRALYRACSGLALLGGLVLLAMTLMSVVSIIGRRCCSAPLTGDFELVQIGCAIAVAAFLPYCQMRRGHVIVDFFTMKASRRTLAMLDAIGALALALAAALVTWRLSAGARSIYESQESSMLLGVPIWYAYVPMALSFALLTLAGLYVACVNFLERGR